MEQRRISVSDGMLIADESWIYAWIDPDGQVIYLGGTGLPIAARTWLHLTSENPEIGRVLAHHPEALTGRVDVVAWRLPDEAERPLVRDAVVAELFGGAPPPTPLRPASAAAVAEILASLRR